jgi:hypothetical protein
VKAFELLRTREKVGDGDVPAHAARCRNPPIIKRGGDSANLDRALIAKDAEQRQQAPGVVVGCGHQ